MCPARIPYHTRGTESRGLLRLSPIDHRSRPVDVDDRLDEGLWRFLRQVVPDATLIVRCTYDPENFVA